MMSRFQTLSFQFEVAALHQGGGAGAGGVVKRDNVFTVLEKLPADVREAAMQRLTSTKLGKANSRVMVRQNTSTTSKIKPAIKSAKSVSIPRSAALGSGPLGASARLSEPKSPGSSGSDRPGTS